MENVPRETKLPKWAIVLMALAILLIPLGSASANTEFDFDAWVKSQGYVNGILWDTGSSDPTYKYRAILSNGTMSYDTTSKAMYFTGTSGYKIYNLNPEYTVTWGSSAFGGSYTYETITNPKLANTDILVYGSSDVFFSKPLPPPYLMEGTTVEEIPQSIVANLRGGLLGLGLTILAVMLGVSLVPRFLYSLSR